MKTLGNIKKELTEKEIYINENIIKIIQKK